MARNPFVIKSMTAMPIPIQNRIKPSNFFIIACPAQRRSYYILFFFSKNVKRIGKELIFFAFWCTIKTTIF